MLVSGPIDRLRSAPGKLARNISVASRLALVVASPSGLVPISDAAITLEAQHVVSIPDGGSAPRPLPDWLETHDPLDAALRDFTIRVGLDDDFEAWSIRPPQPVEP